MVFPDIILEVILGGSERPFWSKGATFELSTDFIGLKSRSRKSRFPKKSCQLGTPANDTGGPGGGPGRDRAPKTLQGRIWGRPGTVLGSFWMDFGRIFYEF